MSTSRLDIAAHRDCVTCGQFVCVCACVWGTVYQTAPDLAVQRRKVTMVFWLNGILLTETQVGDLHFVYGRGGSV